MPVVRKGEITMADNAIRVTEKLGGIRVVGTGGSGGGDGYSKAEIDKKVSDINTSIGTKVSTIDFEASQKVQDERLDELEKGGGTPVDAYTKAESDEKFATVVSQNEQDLEIAKKANETDFQDHLALYRGLAATVQNNIYKKDETMSKQEIEESQAKQDARIKALEDSGGGGVEQDPKWTADKPNYRTKTDQDTIDNGINQAIGTMSMDVQNLKSTKVEKLDFNTSQDAQNTEINALKARLTVPAKATAVSKVVDNVTSNTNNLTFEASPKFYANNGVFTNTNGVITNTVTTDATNNIYIKGSVQLIMAGLISAITTVTISCADDINGVTKVRQFTISSESAFAIPFEFIIPGNKATTNITVTFSGLSGLTSRKIMPTYVTFEKQK